MHIGWSSYGGASVSTEMGNSNTEKENGGSQGHLIFCFFFFFKGYPAKSSELQGASE